ncbi:hypothetical protein [uncultured Methanobrevibacter sp.]|nr:hypothetical protein [uncultured Methanobrevibacter sp.]
MTMAAIENEIRNNILTNNSFGVLKFVSNFIYYLNKNLNSR